MKINPCFSWFHSHPSLLIFSNILICCTYHNLQQLDCWLRRLMNKENYSIYILVYTCNPIDVPNKEICQFKKVLNCTYDIMRILVHLWWFGLFPGQVCYSIQQLNLQNSPSQINYPFSIDKFKRCLWNIKKKPAWMLFIQ